MKKMKKTVAVLLAVLLMLAVFTGCGNSAAPEESSYESVKIGVLTYTVTDSEVSMFRSYLENNLGTAFEVEYLYSSSITSLEEEKAFIDQAKEAGCKGVIAFISNDLEAIVDYCGEDLFYALQNMTPTEEEFEAVKNKPQFLGVISPSNEAEYASGAEIANSLMGQTADSSKEWLVFTGGASYGNNMHTQRAKGILDVLTKAGYNLTCSLEELLSTQTPVEAAQGKDGGRIVVCPGYPGYHTESITKALEMCSADRIAACVSLENCEELLGSYEKKLNKEVKVGLVDCFSEPVADAFEEGKIDFLSGKYGAMVAPTFVAMMNAVLGNEELVKEDGAAYWMNQEVWSAGDKETFLKLYTDSVNVYTNTYCTDELMEAIGAFNADATHEDFVRLVVGNTGHSC